MVKVKYPSENFNLQLAHCGLNTKGLGPCKHPNVKGDDISAVMKGIADRENSDLQLKQQKKEFLPCGSLRGGDCLINPLNCVFEMGDLQNLPDGFCEGD